MVTFWLVYFLSLVTPAGVTTIEHGRIDHTNGNACETQRVTDMQLADLQRAHLQNVNPGYRVIYSAACVPVPAS